MWGWFRNGIVDLIKHRGGCIICMDYSDYNDDYGFLLVNFRSIAKILTNKLDMLRSMSFRSKSAYLFGFSFGARLIARAANDFGPRRIGTIHCKYAFTHVPVNILKFFKLNHSYSKLKSVRTSWSRFR